MKWFKLYNDIIHDPKIRVLAFEDRWHFVALMCLTNDGTLDEPDEICEQLIAVALGLNEADLSHLKRRLMRIKLISEDWKPVSWDKRQKAKDSTGAERQRRFREKQKEAKRYVTEGVTEPLRTEEEIEEEYIDQNASKMREINIPFEDFWNLYPRKVGKAKATQRWPRLTNADREQAMLFLNRNPYADRDKQYIPQGDTFLNKRPWLDDEPVDDQSQISGGVHYR